MDTVAIIFNRQELWAIRDVLQTALAGFNARHETASPWHATTLLAKIRPALAETESFVDASKVLQRLELSEGELICIDLNLPRSLWDGAPALILKVYDALSALAAPIPLNEVEDPIGKRGDWRKELKTYLQHSD